MADLLEMQQALTDSDSAVLELIKSVSGGVKLRFTDIVVFAHKLQELLD